MMTMTTIDMLRLQFIIKDLHNVIESFLGYEGITWRYSIDKEGESVIWEQGNFTATLTWAHVSKCGKWSWNLSMDNMLDRFDASGDDILGEETLSLPVNKLMPLAAPVERDSVEDIIRNDTYQGQKRIGELMFLEPTEAAW